MLTPELTKAALDELQSGEGEFDGILRARKQIEDHIAGLEGALKSILTLEPKGGHYTGWKELAAKALGLIPTGENMNETKEQREARERLVQLTVIPLGWKPLGGCLFERNGKRFDLSAADLTQLARIEREGLFVIH